MNNKIVDYWSELYEQRSDWALRAYDQVVNSLSSDIREKLKHSATTAEPYIVVFGKTQVGKTTLILDLIEIDPSHFSTVSAVLRGGRSSGKSATATAMEYCSSPNESWGITIDGNTLWHDSNEAATAQLGALREQMECAQLQISTPCVVHIPKHYFKLQANSINVRILDLPGDNPANDNEKKHVYHIAKTYLPFADLILLVGRGDDLSYLDRNVITLPGIEDWQIMPHRFRIVTTYSYTAKSIKDKILADPDFDLYKIRQRLIEQIERFEPLNQAARNPELFFPLEFGSSWNGLQASNPELHQKVSKIIAPLRTNLIAQIHESVSTSGRLRSFLNTHTSIKNIWDKKKEALQEKIKLENEKLIPIEHEIALIEKLIALNTKKLLNSEQHYKHVNTFNPELYFSENFSTLNVIVNQFSPSEKSRDHLLSCLAMVTKKLVEFSKCLNIPENNRKEQRRLLKKFVNNCQKIDILGVVLNETESIRKKLHNYSLDYYFRTDNFNSDAYEIKKSLQSTALKISDLFQRELKNQKQKELKISEKIVSKRKIYNSNFEEQLILNKKLHNDVRRSIIDNESLLKSLEEQSLADIERSKLISQAIDSEFEDAFSKRFCCALNNPTMTDSLIEFLSCLDMTQHYRELIALKK